MGTKLCFYSLDLNDQNSLIVPHHIPRHPDHTNDVAPREWWDCDLLEDAGETRLRAVVDEIKTECARLDD
ncbi:hypothetical protein FPV67DRAFT_602652 [Lyophyllum atratum]|nr:hypothetical protein FPV67DRAFT_602652 [Lyophyllum atratum]